MRTQTAYVKTTGLMMPEIYLLWKEKNDISEWDVDVCSTFENTNSRKIIILREMLQALTQIHYDFI